VLTVFRQQICIASARLVVTFLCVAEGMPSEKRYKCKLVST